VLVEIRDRRCKYINKYLQSPYRCIIIAVITLKIDDELEQRLRRRVGRVKGAAKGALSESVEEAIRAWLCSPDSQEPQTHKTFYRALKDGKGLAREDSLDSLSKRLKEIDVDPRDVLIVSEPMVKEKRKMGLRTRSRIAS
jgi:hypothetical protein